MRFLLLAFSIAAYAQGGFNGPGRYEIYSPLSKKVLDMDRGDQRTIIQYDSRRTDNQVWEAVDSGTGAFYFRNTMNGHALAVQNDRNSSPLIAEPFDGSPRQQWRVEGVGDAAVLVNANGKAVDIPYGSTNNSVKINSYNRNNEVNQRWQFLPVAGGGRSRYDLPAQGGRGASRYETAAPAGQRPDRDGMYFDDRERTYKLEGNGVCYYRDRDFQGDAVCTRIGFDRARINSRITSVGSVRFFGAARAVQFFDREDYRGNALEIEREERDLRSFRGVPRSIKIY